MQNLLRDWNEGEKPNHNFRELLGRAAKIREGAKKLMEKTAEVMRGMQVFFLRGRDAGWWYWDKWFADHGLGGLMELVDHCILGQKVGGTCCVLAVVEMFLC